MQIAPDAWRRYLDGSGARTVERFDRMLRGDMDGYAEFAAALAVKSGLNGAHAMWIRRLVEQAVEHVRSGVDQDVGAMPPDKAVARYYDAFMAMCGDWADAECRVLEWLPCMSTVYAYHCPGRFSPYYYFGFSDTLDGISDAFGLCLPPRPRSTSCKMRLRYYDELCVRLSAIRAQMGWSPAQLWAFLYDFAPAAAKKAAKQPPFPAPIQFT